MNTKKLSAISLTLVLVISLVALFGCNSSNPSANNSPSVDAGVSDNIVLSGKYVLTDGTEIFTFSANAFTWQELNDKEFPGTYQISGDKITFTYDDGDVEVYSFSQNETSIFLDKDEYKKQ